MFKFLPCLCAAVFSHAVMATPVAAILTFESRVVTAEGVTKNTHFQERFIRTDNMVWSQRIAPRAEPSHGREDSHEHGHEHKHNLNFALAAKWIVRTQDNQVQFQFVRAEDKTIIVPRVSEYGTLGFDGRWETAYYLLDPAELAKMRKLAEPAAKNASWYESKNSAMFTRILWDEVQQLPLAIETGSIDGSASNKISLTLVAAPKTLPWKELAAYESIAYEDLLD